MLPVNLNLVWDLMLRTCHQRQNNQSQQHSNLNDLPCQHAQSATMLRLWDVVRAGVFVIVPLHASKNTGSTTRLSACHQFGSNQQRRILPVINVKEQRHFSAADVANPSTVAWSVKQSSGNRTSSHVRKPV